MDFTLYRTDEGAHVMKVVFSEGEHKMDVERHFAIDTPFNPNYPMDELKALSARIRAEYPGNHLRQLSKADLPAIHTAKTRPAPEAVPTRRDQTDLKSQLAVPLTDMPVTTPVSLPTFARAQIEWSSSTTLPIPP
ncbi:hypothetical protein ACW9HC_30680 [Nocardia gipuzkoensis]|nr:hypothetical protein [Streptomyces gardneri]